MAQKVVGRRNDFYKYIRAGWKRCVNPGIGVYAFLFLKGRGGFLLADFYCRPFDTFSFQENLHERNFAVRFAG